MNPLHISFRSAAAFAALALASPALAQAPPETGSFADIASGVNKKMVKVFGSGGFRSLASYGSGVIVSPDGYILTVDRPLLNTPELRVHLYDGRRLPAKVVAIDPELDAAVVKIDGKVEDLPCFDLAKLAQTPPAKAGDWILAFSNQFQIATRDEPMSVQRGVVAAYCKLRAQRGVHDAPYQGDVYVLDAITNNPGAAGGALTTRKGELLGLIGKELRNTLTDTWINYAVPINANLEVVDGDKVTTTNLIKFVEEAEKGTFKPRLREKLVGQGGYTGIVLVANPVERTPPYVEEILPDSPAAKAGLKPDDLIVYIDGEQVPSIAEYQKFMEKIRPGTTLALEVRRTDRQEKTDKLVSLKLTVDPPRSKGPAKK
jgi:serine protease Do